MLVLTRKVNEAIQLGESITVTVVSIDADRVKIGIDAPKSLKIFRKELLAEAAGVNREAAAASASGLNAGMESLMEAIAVKDVKNP